MNGYKMAGRAELTCRSSTRNAFTVAFEWGVSMPRFANATGSELFTLRSEEFIHDWKKKSELRSWFGSTGCHSTYHTGLPCRAFLAFKSSTDNFPSSSLSLNVRKLLSAAPMSVPNDLASFSDVWISVCLLCFLGLPSSLAAKDPGNELLRRISLLSKSLSIAEENLFVLKGSWSISPSTLVWKKTFSVLLSRLET